MGAYRRNLINFDPTSFPQTRDMYIMGSSKGRRSERGRPGNEARL